MMAVIPRLSFPETVKTQDLRYIIKLRNRSTKVFLVDRVNFDK
jgi:hypothetical protein